MTCPVCGIRKARRQCPALGQQICPVCCGTKRLVEIQCPSDCVWLAGAREHPAAAVVRQQEQDVARVVHFVRDLSRRQSELFLVIAAFLREYQPDEWQAPVDRDVADAADALAGTLETASRGVIYEHHAESLTAERLVSALKPLLAEARQAAHIAGSAFDRDAAFVLRRLSASIADVSTASAAAPADPRAFLSLVRRVVREPARPRDPGRQGREAHGDDGPRLIVP